MQKALSSDLKNAAAPAPKKYPSRHVRISQKISTLPAMTETFGKYPLVRRTQTSKNIRPFRAERTFGKYTSRSHFPKFAENIRLAHRDRNFREISSRPPYPKLSGKYPSRSPCTRAEIFHVILYVITNSYYIIPYPPCFGARREL